MRWTRVSKQQRCPICSKENWCIIAPDGAVLCMRVVSEKPRTLADGSIGYLHNGKARPVRLDRKPEPEPIINSRKLLCEWRKEEARPVTILADKLGVAPSSLLALGATWAPPHRAWAFGMRDGAGNLVGIRLRSDDGHKFAVRGSHSGIFLPEVAPQRTALIVEGPTNCAAGLSLGYYTIGIPSAGSGVPHLSTAIRRLGIRQVALICDNKDGDISFRSNPTIQKHLPVPSCLLVLPTKDLRSFLGLGGTSEMVDSIMSCAVWKQV